MVNTTAGSIWYTKSINETLVYQCIVLVKHPGRSRPCVMHPWGHPKWYLHSRMRTVYIRRSIKENEAKNKKNRSMIPIGYYCTDCKKFLTTEEYKQKSNERWEDWQAAHPNTKKGISSSIRTVDR
jgi:hypothetical protein